MHFKYAAEDRLEVNGGRIERIVRATYKGESQDIYKADDEGRNFYRYLYYSVMHGWGIAFPGEMIYSSRSNYYWSNEIVCEKEFEETESKGAWFAFASHPITREEEALIESVYPDFKYVLRKWQNKTLYEVIKALAVWKEHPDVELLLAAGLETLAFSKTFYRLTSKTQKRLIKKGLEYPNVYKFTQLLQMTKYDISDSQWENYAHIAQCKISYDEYLFLKKKNWLDYQNFRLYLDYRTMLKQTNHKKDEYWTRPKDLRKLHDRLMKELKAQKLEAKQEQFKQVVKKYANQDKKIAGYHVYIPQDILDVQKQAKSLNQCLITARYDEKVINKQCLLVFIRKNDKPVATAQISFQKKISQFYMDEGDREKMYPTPKIKKVMNKFLEELVI